MLIQALQDTKIFCLSLVQEGVRKKHMIAEFKRLKIANYTFCHALTPTSENVHSFYLSSKVKKFPPCFRCGAVECQCENNYLMPTQVANFLSFMAIFEHIALNEKDEFFMICEDDIVFYEKHLEQLSKKVTKHYLQNVWSYEEKKPFLFRLGSPEGKMKQSETVDIQPNIARMSNCLFMVNKSFCKYIISKFHDISTTSDIFIHKEVGSQVLNLTSIPPLCRDLSWNEGVFASGIRPKKIHVEYLKNQNRHEESQKALEGYVDHIDKINVAKLLVLGHPRGGTKYLSHLLGCMSLDVKHEDMGKDGICSWMFAVDAESPYFTKNYSKYAKRRNYSHFELMVHSVRNPKDSIPSIMIENEFAPASYQYRREFIKKIFKIDLDDYVNKVEKACLSFVYWHKIIATNKPDLVFRLDEDPSKLFCFLQERKILSGVDSREDCLAKINQLPKNINTKKPYNGIVKPVSMVLRKEWEAVSTQTKKELNIFCDQYGYPLLFVDGIFQED